MPRVLIIEDDDVLRPVWSELLALQDAVEALLRARSQP